MPDNRHCPACGGPRWAGLFAALPLMGAQREDSLAALLAGVREGIKAKSVMSLTNNENTADKEMLMSKMVELRQELDANNAVLNDLLQQVDRHAQEADTLRQQRDAVVALLTQIASTGWTV